MAVDFVQDRDFSGHTMFLEIDIAVHGCPVRFHQPRGLCVHISGAAPTEISSGTSACDLLGSLAPGKLSLCSMHQLLFLAGLLLFLPVLILLLIGIFCLEDLFNNYISLLY